VREDGRFCRDVILEQSLVCYFCFRFFYLLTSMVLPSQFITLKDKFGNLGVRYVLSFFPDMSFSLFSLVQEETNEVGGDGTTTATVLAAHAIQSEAVEHVAASCNPWIFAEVPKLPPTVSSNSSPKPSPPSPESCRSSQSPLTATYIGNLISQAMEMVGEKCVITVKEELTIEDEIEIIEGIRFDHGCTSSLTPKPNVSNSRSPSSYFRRRRFPCSKIFLLPSKPSLRLVAHGSSSPRIERLLQPVSPTSSAAKSRSSPPRAPCLATTASPSKFHSPTMASFSYPSGNIHSPISQLTAAASPSSSTTTLVQKLPHGSRP